VRLNEVVNDREISTNGNSAGEQSPTVNERHPVAIDGVAIDESRGSYDTPFWLPATLGRDWSRLLAIAIIILFWTLQFTAYTVIAFMSIPDLVGHLLVPRAINSMAGMLISFAMLAVQARLKRRRLSTRAYAAVLLAIIGTALHVLMVSANYAIIAPDLEGSGPYWMIFITGFINRFWALITISVIILAIIYGADIREREERIDALQALANLAQIRALRSQLNPHFLFNALNSIAGLISAKRAPEAEMMTENLADFLRLALALDPQQPITLDEELKLQGLYLSIEQVRFPGRLNVNVDVPEDVKAALVPNLITQPLIENSIKYAVARSIEPVDLQIIARRIGDRLELAVSDSGGDAAQPSPKGANIGLRNVAARVEMHYGKSGRFTAQPQAGGGFRNVIAIPFRVQ
jgi:hypothetical protein